MKISSVHMIFFKFSLYMKNMFVLLSPFKIIADMDKNIQLTCNIVIFTKGEMWKECFSSNMCITKQE